MKKNKGNNRKPSAFFVDNADKIQEVIRDYVPAFLKIKKEAGAEKAYLYARDMVDEIKVKTDFNSKISCAGKCSFCCHSNIPVSNDEGEYLRKIVLDNAITPNLERLKKQKEAKDFLTLSWADKACSLLSEPDASGNRTCTVYENRPMICRIHNSTEDPNNCDRSKDYHKFVSEIRIPLLDGIMTASLVTGGKQDMMAPKPFFLHDFL